MSRKSRALIEIRLRRSNDLVQQEAVAVVHELWRPDTPHNREKLAFVAHQGNRLFGNDTHWVERRLA
ncbi:hypothetical protein [Variovorax sp. CF079]|uniref:hypothetical protein n=1 Tax=Variovorax sp. CF079 TaxID=1882774 RepID=UPI001113B2BD|nr:hypothetical protein [Variovorax sp. CF079]